MVCYIRGKFTKDFKWLYLRLLLYYKSLQCQKWESSKILIYCLFSLLCENDAQNLELLERIEKLELNTFGENLCQNCMVEQRVKYLEIVLNKILAMNLVDQS